MDQKNQAVSLLVYDTEIVIEMGKLTPKKKGKKKNEKRERVVHLWYLSGGEG